MSGEATIKGLQQAHALFASGKAEQGIAAARRVMHKVPAHPDGARLLSQMLLSLGRVEEARFALKAALDADPENAGLLIASAEVEAMGGQTDGAMIAVDRALELKPKDPRALAVRGRLLLAKSRFTEAASDLRAAAEALGSEPEHRTNLAMALLATGHAREACEQLAAVVCEQPGFLPARATLAQAMNYHPSASAQEVYKAHKAYGSLCESQVKPLGTDGAAVRALLSVDAPVRVGFLTRDLRRHSCAYFLLPILEGLNRELFEPIAYMDDPHEDELTERFRGLFSEWNSTQALSNEALAKRIRKDRIGVLLDLGSHFFGNRLGVMAYRPAPVSVSYLAYPNTTGLTRVDARLVDTNTDPEHSEADSADDLATETLIRLGNCGEPLWCYRPDEGLPEPEAIATDASFTFVSFNDLKKVNDPLLDDWAEILKRVPSARLILKAGALGDGEVAEEVRERFAARGIGADRVELLGHTESHAEHLGLYARAHIALDTHPYCGTTTTLEAAWMGVPTVTLASKEPRHAARVGLSLNTALGLNDFVTRSRQEYVDRAVGLAEEFANARGELNALRLGLRARFEASSLRDEAGFVRRFEGALERAIALQQ